MQRPTTTDTMKQRDEELDKKIEALRRKNEALMKRYQEVEEDKKMAEQEGMALQSRKPEDLSITINKTTNQEPRVVMKKAGLSGGSPQEKSPRGGGEAADGGPTQFSMGRAKRRQLFVTMVGNNKGTRVVSESVDPTPPRPSGRKSSAEEEEENRGGSEPTRRGGRHAQSRKRTSQTQEDGARQEGKAAAEESLWLSECDPYYQDAEWPEPQTPADLNIPTSREEQLEYLRWKAEREQIDRERVARHKNAKGQWRRAWDIDKPQLVFSDKPPGEAVRPQSNRGGRTPRKGHSKSTGESQGHPGRGRERRGKNAPAVVGSKAKGKDRLTGRARRWDTKDRDEEKQASETSLEEFLEELDALCDPENPSSEPSLPQNSDGTTAAAATDDESCVEIGSALETKQTDRTSRSPSGDDDTEKQGNPKVASPKGGEKKVRFSEELVQAAHVQRNPNTVTPETKGSLLKGAPSQMKVDVKTGAEENSTTTESEQTLTLTQTETQTPQQLEEADGKSQEDQNTPDVNATCTENCSPAEPTQRAEVKEKEDETKEDIQKALETDQDKDMEKTDDQPEGEAQEPPSSSAPDTAEQAKTAPSTETEGEASTQPDQAPVQQTPEHTKTSNSRTTEELIDSSLSVLSLDTGDAHPDRVTSTEKAREDGKVV